MTAAFFARALRRRWRLAAITVVSGLVVAAIAHPDWGVRDYEATHVLYSPAAARATGAAGTALVDPFMLKPDAVAALATSRQTAERAAAQLAFDGDPLVLVRRVTSRADTKAGTIEITARRRGEPRGAVAIADAVAKELIALVDESRAGARDKAIGEAQARVDALTGQIAELTGTDAVTRARRDDSSKQYATARAEVENLTDAAATSGISTIRPATARRLPSRALQSLPPAVGWLLTLVMLAAVGSGVAVAAELTDDRLDGEADARSASGLAVLAVVPAHSSERDPAGAFAEALDPVASAHQVLERRLVTHERLSTGTPGSFVVPKIAGSGRVLLFTSPTTDEGKTDTVVNFAAAVSATGRTALIVDCDEAPEAGDDAAGVRGVGDLSAAGIVPSSLASLIQPTALPRVSLVPRGEAGEQAAAFLIRHPHLVQSARDLADVVILHAPHVIGDERAVQLGAIADEAVVVCRSGGTRAADARHAGDAIRAAGLSAGVVLVGGSVAGPPPSFAPADLVARVRTDPKLRGRAEWVVAAVAMLVLYAFIRSFIMESFSIPTSSMAPYLKPGDRVLVSRLSYRLHDVHRGDVVVFNPPKSATGLQDEKLIKRVVALPGEIVESKDGHIVVNGKRLPEKYLSASVKSENVKPQKVPAGRYWVMGDNRTNSADSRFFGTIAKGSIIGRAFFHLWPTPIGLM